MSFKFPLNNRPTHGLLDSLIVIRDLDPRDGILEIFVLIGPESRMNYNTYAMESENAPADLVKNESKAVFVWI